MEAGEQALASTHAATARAPFEAKWIVIGIAVALTAWLSLVPLAYLLWQSFFTAGTASEAARFTFDNYREAYSSLETARLFGIGILQRVEIDIAEAGVGDDR